MGRRVASIMPPRLWQLRILRLSAAQATFGACSQCTFAVRSRSTDMIRRRLNELDAGTLQRSYRQPKACTSHGDRCTKDAMPSIIPGLATRQALGLPLARAEIVAGD